MNPTPRPRRAAPTVLAATAMLIAAASASVAAPATGKEARAMLFAAKGYTLATSSSLSEAERDLMRKVVELSQQQGQALEYYASLAYSPDEGIQSQAFQGASGHHSVAAADAAATAACNALRKPGTRGCTIAARVLPAKYAERSLTLSRAATEAFGKEFKRGSGPRAMAISPGTGNWSVVRGAEATAKALAACNTKAAKAGQADCAIVIAE